MVRRMLTALFAAAALAACGEDATMPLEPEIEPDLSLVEGHEWHALTYEVRITNLTSGQAFTPPLAVTHRPALRLFRVGRAADERIQQIAENGNLAPMLDFVNESRHVHQVVVAAGDPVPPLLPGEERVFTIEASASSRWFSFASMLICTNDGFTGIDRVRLPRSPGASRTIYTGAYDAGTEINTEDFDDLVPPCGPLSGIDTGGAGTGMSKPALAEHGRIRHHMGISGEGDLLPSVHGWTDPVARVVITRVH